MARTYIKVPFPQKDAAKSLGAKWDADAGSWYVPDTLDVAAFAAWLPGQFPAAVSAPADAPARSVSMATLHGARALTTARSGVPLSRLLAGVADAVAAVYKAGVWTTVEVTDVKPRGGHVYLELSERDRQGTLVAKATGTLWAGTANRILPEFERATGAVLAPGIKLLVRARPVYKPQFGFSLDIDAIDPDYTLGDLEARKREIRARLQAEGVFGAQKLLPAPWDFNAVLVVAPDGAAGLGDFQAESVRLSVFGVCGFTYVHSRFQGEGAAAAIGHALLTALERWPDAHDAPPDAVVIIRGGGAVNDLAWLNDHALVRLVCELPVPVFTGIGHERDRTLLDEVAHTAFDTPSKVIAGIEQVIGRRTREALEAFQAVIRAAARAAQASRAAAQRCDGDVRGGAIRQLELATRRTAEHFGSVKEVSVATIHQALGWAKDTMTAVRQGSAQAVAAARTASQARADFGLERAGSHRRRVRADCAGSMATLSQSAQRVVQDARRLSESLVREIAGQGPQKNLARGFAVVRNGRGAPVTRAQGVAPGQVVSVQFADGSVAARVDGETG